MSDERSINRHAIIRTRSYKLLDDARLAASTSEAAYDSQQTRSAISQLFKARSGTGKTPYDWQLDVTEAILLGLDSMVIAGTGSGKTIPFMLPLLAHPGKNIIIISPLKVLQQDQVCDKSLTNILIQNCFFHHFNLLINLAGSQAVTKRYRCSRPKCTRRCGVDSA